MIHDEMVHDGGFDLVLAIPCERVEGNYPSGEEIAAKSFGNFNAKKVLFKNNDHRDVQNAAYFDKNDMEGDIKGHAQLFCDTIADHGNYELIFDESIKTTRKPFLYGNVIIYQDILGEEKRKKPVGYYNFFCVLSELSIAEDNLFTIIYFVVPDINYHDLTLLMDQSHDLWCAINDNEQKEDADNPTYLNHHLLARGYHYFGKIYHIVFSDKKQFDKIEEIDTGNKAKKIFNILAAETRKPQDTYSHQLALSEHTQEYALTFQGYTPREYKPPAAMSVTKKESFFDEYYIIVRIKHLLRSTPIIM